ncbi:MAG: translation initiation factor IF-1 [Bryobacterales bacterium]|nr:translation initiation factor IF-1 [Bryobacterales bacterium]
MKEEPVSGAGAVEATVVEILPAATYRVELANREQVTAHLTRPTEANFVRLRVRDHVLVKRSAADPARGRIVKVLEKP